MIVQKGLLYCCHIVILFSCIFFNRTSRRVEQKDVKYRHKQQKITNENKVGAVDGEVVMEDCLACGTVQVRTDITSQDQIEVPRVYEAI